LNPKQKRFIAEYLIDLNATQAAVRAGYSRATAYAQGQRLLKHAEVASAVESGQRDRMTDCGISRERVLTELALLAFSNVEHYVVDEGGNVQLASGAPPGAMRAVSSIKRKVTHRGTGELASTTYEVELKLWDKPGPLKTAGQHKGLFRESVEVAGPDGSPIVVTFGGRHRAKT
jgi:phage terminase small subunit